MTAKNIETLKAVYMFIYDEFAADTKDIREKFGFTNAKAYDIGRQLEDMGLVCGEIMLGCGLMGGSINAKTHPGTPVMWQCWETDGSIERDEAEQLFDSRVQIFIGLLKRVDAFGQHLKLNHVGEIIQPK